MSLETPGGNKEMSQESIDLLRNKVSESAHKVGEGLSLQQEDIDLVTKAIVIGAERSGNPLTTEELNAFGPELQTVILGGLVKRLEARPTGKFRMIDASTLEVVGDAWSKREVGEKAQQERELGK